MFNTIITKIVNSNIYFKLYYSRTKKFKKELNDVRKDVLEIRKRAIGK